MKKKPINWYPLRYIAHRLSYALLGAAAALAYVYSQPIQVAVDARCAFMFKMPDGFYETT